MNKVSKFDIKYFILVILLVLLVFLGVTTLTVKQNRKLNPVESVIKDTSLFVSNIVTSPVHFVINTFNKYKEFNNVYDKYNKLKNEVEKTDLLAAKIKELETEIKALNETLLLNKNLTDYNYLNTTVINRNIGYWYNNITVDKGSSSGVRVGMAVINHHGLVGKVIKTTSLTSTIKLLTSNEVDNKISVKIKVADKDIYGLFTGYNKDTKSFVIEGIDENTDIPVGSTVVTTGMGGIFPSGLLVGNVKSVSSDNFDLSKIISVESQVNFNELLNVTILKGVK